MSVRQRKDGSWQIESASDLEKAVTLVEEREEMLREIETKMEEEFDYLTTREEVESLNAAITSFMARSHIKHVFRDNYKITMVERVKLTWDEKKLRSLLPKNLWLKVTKQVIDSDKIDDLVRGGQIDRATIAPALTEKSEKPHIRRFPYKDGQDRDAAMSEEAALRVAMSNEAAAAAPAAKRGKQRDG